MPPGNKIRDNDIRVEKVSFGYDNNSVQLKNITLEIKKGSFFGITGVNGSGKTTLTLLLNGLIPSQIKGKYKGDVFIDGVNTRDRPVSIFAKKVGMLFQNPDFMLFNLTVREEIEFGLKNLKLNNYEKRIKNALRSVGMEDHEDKDPQTLSFGQKQKICLACILALESPYIVLDEPTAMLDYPSAVKLYTLLHSLNKSGKTIIIVEHDTDFLKKYCSEIVVLDHGNVALNADAETVFSKIEAIKKIGIKVPNSII